MQKKKKPEFILVISWWGAKGMYACWVLKAIEEMGLKSSIKAIYGVSAGALTGAYWLSGWKADEIVQNYLNSELFSLKNIALPPTQSLLKRSVVEKLLKKDLKKTFEQLEKPLIVGTTDLRKGKSVFFESGDLIKPVLWSMSIPGVFAPIEYEKHLLVDGGVTDNFPIDYAKKQNPNTKTIGILLGKFKTNQKVKNILDTLMVSYEILLRWRLNATINKADILFYRNLSMSPFESNEKKLIQLFDQGYHDGIATFSSLQK